MHFQVQSKMHSRSLTLPGFAHRYINSQREDYRSFNFLSVLDMHLVFAWSEPPKRLNDLNPHFESLWAQVRIQDKFKVFRCILLLDLYSDTTKFLLNHFTFTLSILCSRFCLVMKKLEQESEKQEMKLKFKLLKKLSKIWRVSIYPLHLVYTRLCYVLKKLLVIDTPEQPSILEALKCFHVVLQKTSFQVSVNYLKMICKCFTIIVFYVFGSL